MTLTITSKSKIEHISTEQKPTCNKKFLRGLAIAANSVVIGLNMSLAGRSLSSQTIESENWIPLSSAPSSCISELFTGIIGTFATSNPLPLALGIVSCVPTPVTAQSKCTTSANGKSQIPLSEFSPEAQSFLKSYQTLGEHYENMSPDILNLQNIQCDSVIVHPQLGVEQLKSYIENTLIEALDEGHQKRYTYGISDLQPPDIRKMHQFLDEKKYSDQVIVKSIPELSRYFSKSKKDRTIEEKIACFKKLREIGLQSAASAKGRAIVLFLGPTDAGKSTLINFLHGCKMQKKKITGMDSYIVSPESPVKQVMSIGASSNVSHTILPRKVSEIVANTQQYDKNRAFTSAYTEELDLYDLPGLWESRGIEVALANACNTATLVKAAKSIKVVVVVTDLTIMNKRGSEWKEFAHLLHERFNGVVNENNIHLVVTKTTRSIQDIKEHLAVLHDPTLKDFNLSKCATIYNPLSASDRDVQLEFIQKNFIKQPLENLVLTATELADATELAEHLKDYVENVFNTTHRDKLKMAIEFAQDLQALNNPHLTQKLDCIKTALVDQFKKKYSHIGTKFQINDKKPPAVIVAEYENYVNKMMADYETFFKETKEFNQFASFEPLFKDTLDRMSKVIVSYLQYFTVSIQSMIGKDARNEYKKFEREMERLSPSITHNAETVLKDCKSTAQTALIDQFKKEYSHIGTKFQIDGEKTPPVNVAEYENYVNKMMADYETFSEETKEFNQFVSFKPFLTDTLDRISEVIVSYLQYFTVSIQSMSGHAARSEYKKFEQQMVKLSPFIRHNVNILSDTFKSGAKNSLNAATKSEDTARASLVAGIAGGSVGGLLIASVVKGTVIGLVPAFAAPIALPLVVITGVVSGVAIGYGTFQANTNIFEQRLSPISEWIPDLIQDWVPKWVTG